VVVVPAGAILLGCALAGTAHVSALWQDCLAFGALGADRRAAQRGSLEGHEASPALTPTL
jgi:hypothetical protein